MDKTFNELFDEFFKRDNNSPKISLDDQIKDDVKKIIDILSQAKGSSSIDESMEQQMDESLGKPDKIEFYNEGHMFYEKRTWNTPNGKLVKLIVTDDPTLIEPPIPEKSLDEQLKEAVENEDFEKAAELRDKIGVKKTRRSRKKSEE